MFTSWWMLETKKDVEKTEEMIEFIIEYMDARKKEGLGDHTWDDAEDPSNDSSRKREVCNNWQLGKCTKGNKCPRKHVGKSGAKASSPPRRTGTQSSTSEHTGNGESARWL